ncbi:MAG: thioredoxin domain-containing protein [Chloroflexi bacterium]|nr:thioredoxin domain-containing protein [Chloroflexota bacterium]
MLYDNAQLARAYVYGYQVAGEPDLRAVASATLDYVLREMTDPGGGFYSTEDADSEGQEGKFYVWNRAQLIDALGPADGRAFAAAFDVSEAGSFEHGFSVLHPIASQAPSLRDRFGTALREVRARRVRPGRDDKIVTAWNGLMLRTLADAAPVLDRPDLLQAAERAATFLLTTMRRPDGRLYRTWKPGHPARINGYLEDYATVADGLTALYAISFDRAWLDAAVELVDIMLAHFSDPAGGFFDTADDHETLITRPKDVFDSATPSGNAVAAEVLLRLAMLTDNADYRALAERTLAPLAEPMQRYPLGFARALSAVDFLLSDPAEVAIVGPSDRADTRALLQATFAPFLPNKVVAGAVPDDGDAGRGVPLLAQRGLVDGRAAAYVCQHYVCQAPVTTAAALASLLPTSRASAR